MKRVRWFWFLPVLIPVVVLALLSFPFWVGAQSGPGGWMLTTLLDNSVSTYGATYASFNPASTPTELACLTGSTGSTIRVKRVVVTAYSSTAGEIDLVLLKRTTPTTAGTSSTPTIAKYDSTQGAPVGVFTVYSANPTVGTGVALRDELLNFGLTGAAGKTAFDFSTANDKPLLLKATTESACLNLAGAALPGTTGARVAIEIEWQESTP